MPSKADSDVWMRCNDNAYEYVAIYEDNLLCTRKDPRNFLNQLIKVHKYELKADVLKSKSDMDRQTS